jgi:malate synthase
VAVEGDEKAMTRDAVEVLKDHAAVDAVLTVEARAFLASLHRRFDAQRRALLDSRVARQAAFDAGATPSFLAETAHVRGATWQVKEPPRDLQNRRVEITGPATPKMMINALNSGANVFMADLEDALSPTWANVLEGQIALGEAVRRELRHVDATTGKEYALGASVATLVVRPRGWHLEEKQVLVDGQALSASLFDAGLYLFHNAHEAVARGTGPYFYLPKLEGHREARLWNEVFEFSEDELGLPRGSVRPTVLIETLTAAFEMDEILFELRERVCGLNAGRWDYIFSAIKKLHAQSAATTNSTRSRSRASARTSSARRLKASMGPGWRTPTWWGRLAKRSMPSLARLLTRSTWCAARLPLRPTCSTFGCRTVRSLKRVSGTT